MAFTRLNLHPKILQAIEACGYTKPTPVQLKSIPNILSGKDVVASAQTGTGKTAAYVLPALQLLATKKSTSKKARILILAPTRELAGQITKVIGKYGKFIKPNIASFVGGVAYHRQLKELSGPIDIIIATPGRLMDHMENQRLDLSHIEMLVVDEADRMLDMGFINDIKTIVKATPKTRQTLLFSATADDKLLSIMNNLLTKPVRISISEDKIDSAVIKQKIHVVTSSGNKKVLLEQIIDEENIFKAIIFSSTKRNAGKLADHLKDLGYSASPMHGDLKQSARNRTLTQFRKGEVQFLVATDVAARGIDVMDITHVINYDLPKFAEDYVHRIGRTGRAGKTGIAISIVLQSEAHQVRKIERYISDKIQVVRMTKDGEQEAFFIDDSADRAPRSKTNKKRHDRRSKSNRTDRSDRSDGDRKPKRDYASKSDGARKPKRDYASKSDGARKPKRDHAAWSDGTRKPKRDYAAGSDGTRKPKRDYAAGSDGTRKPKRDHAAGSDGTRKPKRDYAAGSDGTRKPKRDYAAGSDGTRKPKRDHAAGSDGTRKPKSRRTAKPDGARKASSGKPRSRTGGVDKGRSKARKSPRGK